METDGKEVLMHSVKKLTDLRGAQRRIGRLASFHFEAYIHILFYRIVIPLSIVFGICVLVSFAVPQLVYPVRLFTLVIWALWTPQFFEVAKGLSLSWSRGMAFGHMNKEFARLYRKRYSKKPFGYLVFPYFVLAIWVAGFVVMIVRL
jgi:hypothetical protein